MSELRADTLVAVNALRLRMNGAFGLRPWPKTLTVPGEDLEAVEDYLEWVGRENRREWEAAGSPDEWHKPLHLLFQGPNGGVMFKNVELLISYE
jgi:hypothetical protein